MGFLTTWAGKLGLTALYNLVKGFFDSWFESRRKDKELAKREAQARDQLSAETTEKTLDAVLSGQKSRDQIERDHVDDDWVATLRRMRDGRDKARNGGKDHP